MKAWMSALCLFIFTAIMHVRCTDHSVVALPIGRVRGLVADDKSSVVFKGVRYGSYPKRFSMASIEEKTHEGEGVYDAFHYGASCPQSNRINLVPHSSAQHQVMVFIHGGGYVQGSGNDLYIDGTEYAKKGAILVSLNYRVGLFGFFAHSELTGDDPENPTNFGLLDQVVALKWIKKYIHYFGGNPDDITVFGESAGANAIQWLMAHKDHATHPLFTRAILQSSPAATAPFDLHEAEVAGKDFAEQIGCQQPNALSCLRQKDVQSLLALGVKWDRKGLPSLSIAPIPRPASVLVSPHVDYKNFPVHPALGGINEIILGTTQHEWMLFIWLQHLFMLPSDEWMNEAVRLIFSSEHFIKQTPPKLGLSERLEKLYPRDAFESGLYRVAAIYTDMVFYCPSRNYAKKLVEQGASVHFYLYSHETTHGLAVLKANHASELPYVFQKTVKPFYIGAVKVFPDKFTNDELRLSNEIIDLWMQLGKEDLHINSTKWPEFSSPLVVGEHILNISLSHSVMQGQFLSEQCRFWEEVTPTPQRHIVFDIMAHEPFVLKLVNEYTLELAMLLIKNALLVVMTLSTVFIMACYFTLRRAPNKKKPHKD